MDLSGVNRKEIGRRPPGREGHARRRAAEVQGPGMCAGALTAENFYL